jgi:hypothetical protein
MRAYLILRSFGNERARKGIITGLIAGYYCLRLNSITGHECILCLCMLYAYGNQVSAISGSCPFGMETMYRSSGMYIHSRLF